MTTAAAGGRWEAVHQPDGSWRQDWIPDEQPPSPDGTHGAWHVVADMNGGDSRWEWHPAPLPPPPMQHVQAAPQPGAWTPAPIAPDHRRYLLNQRIQAHVHRGARVESQTEFSASLVKGRPTRHGWNLLGTIVSGGLWIFGWAALMWINRTRREFVAVDEWGRISTTTGRVRN